MAPLTVTSRSLRSIRVSARLPRMIAGALAAILMIAGLRAVIAPAPKAPAAARTERVVADDLGASSFAEGFVRAYLTWSRDEPDDTRLRRLAPYARGLDPSAGLRPGTGSAQQVLWTAVLGERRRGPTQLITVAAQVDDDLVYVSVPVGRDARGYLGLAAYPAFVGPPATRNRVKAPDEESVADGALIRVISRALRNYLAANGSNLLADLTPDALVSVPTVPLRMTGDQVQVTWVTAGRRVAAQVEVSDAHKSTWTLRYELDVQRRDRWYVRSIQVDPTFRATS
jgi:hypothetical protein